MLMNLINRINKDENLELNKEVFVECSHIGTMHSHIEKFAFINPEKDFSDLKQKLSSVILSDTDSIECNMDKLVSAAKSDVVMTEAVVSTSKTISITKEDYDELCELIKVLKRASSEKEERKNAKNKIKSFLRACTKEIGKCNDNNPADAFVIGIINKLCKAFECEVDNKDDITRKALLVLKLNALAKTLSRIK